MTIAPLLSSLTAATLPVPLRDNPQGRIAFQSEREGNLEIYAINADGNFLSRLSNNPAVDVFPAWSPDGEKIVLGSDRAGGADIYIMKFDDSGLQKLTDFQNEDFYPA